MSGGGPPDVVVLIVNWNTRTLLAECLTALECVQGLCVQTIVVDNASSDDSAGMVRTQFPGVRLLALSENLGFVAGNNHAYRETDPAARYVLLLNPDAILRPRSLETLAAWMEAHPQAGACGPLTLNPDGTLQPSWTRFPTVWSEIRGHHERRFRGPTQPSELSAEGVRALPDALPVDWVSGACLLVRRTALSRDLEDVLFDPAFQMYSEETDLCYRLRRNDWPTYFVPQAEVVHHYGQSSKQAPVRTACLLYRSKLLFFRKHYGTGRAGLLQAGMGAASAAKWAIFRLLSLPPSPRRGYLQGQSARQRAVLLSMWKRAEP
jgi:GT2 family glycosyltransferase